MTLGELRDKVNKWDRKIPATGNAEPATSKYGMILNQLDHHAEREWRVYLPAQHPDFQSRYMDRLAAWLGNMPQEEDQKTLLHYASYISFFSHEDFVALYRTAMEREIRRWVAEQVSARLDATPPARFNDRLNAEINQHTWFCPITDSMDINEFYKMNHLAGIQYHPQFAYLREQARTLSTIASQVQSYMANPSSKSTPPNRALERIVLLEDIVGSSTQCANAIDWALRELGKPVLFVPLILCPNGRIALSKLENSHPTLSVRPVIELRQCDLLGPARGGNGGWPIAEAVERLATDTVASRMNLLPNQAFGYKQTGCSLATFTNTPDNSLPMIHHRPTTGGWQPLFPRVYRD